MNSKKKRSKESPPKSQTPTADKDVLAALPHLDEDTLASLAQLGKEWGDNT